MEANKHMLVLFLLSQENMYSKYTIYNFFKFRKNLNLNCDKLLIVDKFMVLNLFSCSELINTELYENILFIYYNKRLYFINFFNIFNKIKMFSVYINTYLLKISSIKFKFNFIKVLFYIKNRNNKNAYI